MAGGGGDGDGRGGEGVDVVGVVGGGVGGGVAASAATASAGWRRGDSARGRIPAAGGADPLPRPRHEESNLEPRQLGAAGADHHRGRSAQPPCQAAPPHRQTGQATAERAAQRRQPNGGVRPGGPTIDSLIWTAGLPNSGTAPPMVQPESPAALLTCLGRHTAAHPPAADGPPAYPSTGEAEAPVESCFGCPEPCTRRGNPPKQQRVISDFVRRTFARSASRPNFAIGAWRPQAQNVARHRLQLFDRRRGWGGTPRAWHRSKTANRISATDAQVD